MSFLPYMAAFYLLCIGLYGIVSSRSLIHTAFCLFILQSSTYVLLIAIGFVHHGRPPVFMPGRPALPAVDPVVQALVLTDIIISAAVTGLLIALTLENYKRTGSINPNKRHAMKG
jgi:multicomponent Na+:H+ antiporter subunit C